MYGEGVSEEGRETRAPLNRQRVLAAARDIADSEGVSGLSMRRLGRALGVEAMSLYSHVESKEDLLDGLTELVAAEVPLPSQWTDWRESVRELAMATNAALSRHSWAGYLWATRTLLGTNRAAIMDGLLHAVELGGFPKTVVHRAFHVLENHIIGYALRASSFPLSRAELPAAADRFLANFKPEALPYLARHIAEHGDPEFQTPEGDNEFRFGLDLILDGLAGQR